MDTTYDTDHGPSCCKASQPLTSGRHDHYFEIHHKPSDTYDKIDPLDFKAGTAIVAVTAWAIAEDPKPIAPRSTMRVAEISKGGTRKLLAASAIGSPRRATEWTTLHSESYGCLLQE